MFGVVNLPPQFQDISQSVEHWHAQVVLLRHISQMVRSHSYYIFWQINVRCACQSLGNMGFQKGKKHPPLVEMVACQREQTFFSLYILLTARELCSGKSSLFRGELAHSFNQHSKWDWAHGPIPWTALPSCKRVY